VLLGVLLALLSVHAAGVFFDFMASIRYPFQWDYGEGIVWQQAALIPGPLMYSNSQSLPFIVFHYPPLFYLLARAALWIQPDFLSAGRLVSSLSAVLIAIAVAGLVWISARRPSRSIAAAEFAIALATGLLVLCLHAVHNWGMLMRVDMAAIAFGMMGLVVGAWANGRFWGTAMALLICVASVFTKQTQLPVGVAVFLVALLRNPCGALCAAALAGVFGLGALGLMQGLTEGGFLHNIIGYNINSFSPRHAYWVFWPERSSFLFMALMLIAAGATLLGLFQRRPTDPRLPAIGQFLLRFRLADRAMTSRAMLLVHFALASLMLFYRVQVRGLFQLPTRLALRRLRADRRAAMRPGGHRVALLACHGTVDPGRAEPTVPGDPGPDSTTATRPAGSARGPRRRGQKAGSLRGHDPADARWETSDLRARYRDRISFARTMGPGASGEHDPLGWLCFHDHYRRHARR
jgi:hypothetical protein